MSNNRARLITVNDYPPETEVFRAGNALEALKTASQILSGKGARKKAAIWEPESNQYDRARSHDLSDVYNQMARAGYEVFGRKSTAIGEVTRHEEGGLLVNQTFERDAPMLLQIVSAVRAFNNTSLFQAISTEKDVAIALDPHFDQKNMDMSSRGSEKIMSRLRDLYNEKLFLSENCMRIIWNEKAPASEDDRLGTLLWFDEDVPQLQTDAAYRHLLDHGNMSVAAAYAKVNFGLTTENARQVPNSSVLFLGHPQEPNPSDFILHSIMPKKKSDRSDAPWTMHAVDVKYTPPPKYPWLNLKPLA